MLEILLSSVVFFTAGWAAKGFLTKKLKKEILLLVKEIEKITAETSPGGKKITQAEFNTMLMRLTDVFTTLLLLLQENKKKPNIKIFKKEKTK
jgi:hypothetical protein